MNARTDPASLAAIEPRFAILPSGLRLPHVAGGAGETLLFVHGSLCDYRYWSGQVAVLSRHFHCVSVSLGHYWPADASAAQGGFGWQAHVDQLAAFIDAMQLGRVHLVGHSRGACVAFQLARQHPQLLASLVLADPGGPLQVDGQPPAALAPATLALRETVADLIGAGDIEAGLEMFVDSVSMPGIWRRSSAAFRAMAAANAATLPLQFRDPLPAYTRAAAAEVACRTLLVAGERSPRMYRDNVASLAAWLPCARSEVIAGASHGMNVTHPGSFNRLLQGFAGA